MHETTTNTEAIRQALDLLTVPWGVVELRGLHVPGRGKPCTVAVYFTDLKKVAQAAAFFDGQRRRKRRTAK